MSLIETIVGELQRIGRVNALAALAALVAGAVRRSRLQAPDDLIC
jgi:hypothetical protein